MHECYVMQILETKGKTQKNQRTKNDGHKGKNKETQAGVLVFGGESKKEGIRGFEAYTWSCQ